MQHLIVNHNKLIISFYHHYHNNNNNNNNNKNNQYSSRVTPSLVRTVINGGPDVQIEFEFRSVGFCGGRKIEEPGEKPSEQGKNQQQTQTMRVRESNLGHRGRRRALIHRANHGPHAPFVARQSLVSFSGLLNQTHLR